MAESSDGGTVESNGLQPNLDYFCQPCDEADEHTKAEGFCKHCSEFLCQTCIKYHRRSKVSKYHEILDEALMAQEPKPCKRDKSGISEVCPKHSTTKELIKYYCIDHDSLSCRACIASEHSSCKVDLIINLSSNFHESKEFKEFCEEIGELNENFGAMQKTVANSMQTEHLSNQKALENIRKLNKDLTEHFKTLEADMLTEAKNMLKEDLILLNKLNKKSQKEIEEIEEIQTSIKSKGNADSDLFIISKKMRTTLKKLNESYAEIKESFKNSPRIYGFRSDKVFEDALLRKPFGKIERLQSWFGVPYATVTCLVNINVKSSEDQMECSISGMIPMANKTLLLADYNNHAIKVLNITTKSLLSRFALPAGPRDIAKISDDKMAITLPTMKCVEILVFRDGALSELSSFKVGGECYGIDYFMDKFAVTYINDPRVEILDISGNVIGEIKTFRHDITFKSPRSVKFRKNDKEIVVCDFKAKTIYQFSLSPPYDTCRILCKEKHIYSPHGLAFTSDDRFVFTSFGNLTLFMPAKHEICSSCDCTMEFFSILAGNKIEKPQALHLLEEEGLIFVGCSDTQHPNYNGNNIKVFKFSE